MKSVKPLLAVLLLFSYVYGQDCVSGKIEIRDHSCNDKVPNSIKIGSLEYGGTNSSGVSTYIVKLDTTGVTAAPLTFGDIRVHVNGTFQDSTSLGPITTPANIAYLGGPPPFTGIASCVADCVVIVVQLFSSDGNPMTFGLANGQQFTTWGVNTTVLRPRIGKAALVSGQSTPIYLRLDTKGL